MTGTAGNATTRDRLVKMRLRIVSNESARTTALATAAAAAGTATTTATVADAAALPPLPLRAASPWLDALLLRNDAAAKACLRQTYDAQFGPAAAPVGAALGFEAAVSRLLGLCSGALRTEFDMGSIRSQAYARAPAVAAAPAVSALGDSGVSAAEAAAALGRAVLCPIMLDDGSDLALLLARPPDGLPLLAKLDARAAKWALENPLNLLRHADFMGALRGCLDATVLLRALQAADASGRPMFDSPTTRRRLCGAIVMGPDAGHAQASDAALAAFLSDGALFGNLDLWYAVVFFAVRDATALTERPSS